MPDDDRAPRGLVVTDGRAARSRLQTSDVILSSCPAPTAGRRWTTAMLSRYPGCLVAVAYDSEGRWSLHNVRGIGGMIIRPLAGRLGGDTLRALALLSHLDSASCRNGGIRPIIGATGSPVMIRGILLWIADIDVLTGKNNDT
jgi:hypothetical protein